MSWSVVDAAVDGRAEGPASSPRTADTTSATEARPHARPRPCPVRNAICPSPQLKPKSRTVTGGIAAPRSCFRSIVPAWREQLSNSDPGDDLDVVVQVELPRVGAQADLVDLVLALVGEPGLDEVGREHAAR